MEGRFQTGAKSALAPIRFCETRYKTWSVVKPCNLSVIQRELESLSSLPVLITSAYPLADKIHFHARRCGVCCSERSIGIIHLAIKNSGMKDSLIRKQSRRVEFHLGFVLSLPSTGFPNKITYQIKSNYDKQYKVTACHQQIPYVCYSSNASE